jgi:hypothetical protein
MTLMLGAAGLALRPAKPRTIPTATVIPQSCPAGGRTIPMSTVIPQSSWPGVSGPPIVAPYRNR